MEQIKISLGVLAERLQASVLAMGLKHLLPPLKIKGDKEVVITNLTSADGACPGALTFAISPDFLAQALKAEASAIIVTPALAESDVSVPLLVTTEPRLIFSLALGILFPAPKVETGQPTFADDGSTVILGTGVSFGAQTWVGRRVKIGARTIIHPQVFIEDDVEIGEDCIIHPRAVLRSKTKIGNRCQIHSGAVIGEDGFGYTQVPDYERGRLLHVKNEHRGCVVIEDDVEIGALTTIDKALVAETRIQTGTKIDNLVQIGHNCSIGRDCLLVSQVGLAGHCQIGDRAFILGQAGLGPGAIVGQDAILAGHVGVQGGKKIPAGRQIWAGTPARSQDEVYRIQALANSQLPKVYRFFQSLKKATSFEDLKSSFMSKGKE